MRIHNTSGWLYFRIVDCSILENDGKTLDFSKDATYFDIFEHLFKSDTLSDLENLDEIPTIDLPTDSVDHRDAESIDEQQTVLESTTDPLINLLDNHTTGFSQFRSEAEIFAFFPDGHIHLLGDETVDIAGGMQQLSMY